MEISITEQIISVSRAIRDATQELALMNRHSEKWTAEDIESMEYQITRLKATKNTLVTLRDQLRAQHILLGMTID